MEERWVAFLSDRIAELTRRLGHRQVKTLFQPGTGTIEYRRELRNRSRENRLPR
jgi:hypothetical protein